MVYLVQRVIVNDYGWTRPSPRRLGPVGEGEYVRTNGFGFEDWNFNTDLAIDGYVYGYTCHQPSKAKVADTFHITFMTYSPGQWHLVGFYLDAEYVPNGAPVSAAVLRAKARHLAELKANRSLGGEWARLSEDGMVRKLREELQWFRWKVHLSNVLPVLGSPAVSEKTFRSRNYRLTSATEIDASTFKALRSFARRRTSAVADNEDGFPEGRAVRIMHTIRERNSAVVSKAKSRFRSRYGKLFCEVCGFDFEAVYGELGRDFIEAHHTVPVSQLDEASKTSVSDIALVCSNCHRMLHRRRPWLKMTDLKTLLRAPAKRV
jgi:predicted HNH restriction endonuclease